MRKKGNIDEEGEKAWEKDEHGRKSESWQREEIN